MCVLAAVAPSVFIPIAIWQLEICCGCYVVVAMVMKKDSHQQGVACIAVAVVGIEMVAMLIDVVAMVASMIVAVVMNTTGTCV